jgi:hypothetical protein
MYIRIFSTIALSVTIGISMSLSALAANSYNLPNGPMYAGAPDLPVAADLIQAGGGAGSFSMVRAWDNIIGTDVLQGELSNLTDMYGKPAADQFVHIFDFAMADAWMRAGQDDVKMPQATGTIGRPLAFTMLRDGKSPDGTFWTGYMLEHILTQRVYTQVSSDIDNKYGPDANAQFNRVSNQFFKDVAQQIGTADSASQ